MTGEEIGRILAQVTQDILDGMRRDGFIINEGDPVRFDPVVWDINNGYCNEWAALAAERLGENAYTEWIDPYHCVLFYQGRWYDADCPEGEPYWADLPMFADPAHERPEPLQENCGTSRNAAAGAHAEMDRPGQPPDAGEQARGT
jgi:hypothetical protein